jgi:hypothetical protein
VRWWRTTELISSHGSEMDFTAMRVQSSAVTMGSRYDNQVVPPTDKLLSWNVNSHQEKVISPIDHRFDL